MKTNPNDLAQPVSVTTGLEGDVYNSTDVHRGSGLTKREHFAGLALQGGIEAIQRSQISAEDVAYLALKLADELIDALNEKKV